jgi:hypothetical protein
MLSSIVALFIVVDVLTGIGILAPDVIPQHSFWLNKLVILINKRVTEIRYFKSATRFFETLFDKPSGKKRLFPSCSSYSNVKLWKWKTLGSSTQAPRTDVPLSYQLNSTVRVGFAALRLPILLSLFLDFVGVVTCSYHQATCYKVLFSLLKLYFAFPIRLNCHPSCLKIFSTWNDKYLV